MNFYTEDGTLVGDAAACAVFEAKANARLTLSSKISNFQLQATQSCLEPLPQLFPDWLWTINQNLSPEEVEELGRIVKADAEKFEYPFDPDDYTFDAGSWYLYVDQDHGYLEIGTDIVKELASVLMANIAHTIPKNIKKELIKALNNGD